MVHPRSVVSLLQDLIAIPSVNPSGDPGVARTGELELARYVADFLRHCGAEVELREISAGRPNVVARFPCRRPRARLAFAPHLDTVSVVGMTIPPFEPHLRDGRIYGRGATDAKGPMAAALWALADWAARADRSESAIEWTLLGLMNEEAGGSGAQAIRDSGFESDLILVLEPTELAVITAQKGAAWFEVTTQGRACHGSTPELGHSAIRDMGAILRALDEKLIPELARDLDPTEGRTTLNVGTIAGGSKINIVPDRCRIEMDCRFVSSRNVTEIQRLVEEVVHGAVAGAEINMWRYAPPLHTERSLPWVSRLALVANGFAVSPWSSDAGVLNTPHSPSVCIGPGHVSQAHTADESIAVADLEAGAAFFRRWMDVAEKAAGAD